ncbi:hypothetical protein [Massilia sp. PWRC2]|uniref:hypothetical protein n=1 Tax=Massilia sp. PWRC2 TaxID=2804626 RepID=UPI003CF6A0BB
MLLRPFQPCRVTACALLAALLACAPAAAIDFDELKRLARLDASREAQQEAAERATAQAAAQAANRQLPPKAAPLSGTASQMDKLARGFEEAHAAAPNRWYQAAKIEDFTPPGDDQRKVYRITGALVGPFCVRYQDKNKADQGRANVGEPLIGSCPRMF